MAVFEAKQSQAGSVTVIISVHNSERYVRCALDSVLKQTHAVGQVVVVDSGSTDSTRQVVAQEYSGRAMLIEQQAENPASARNAGLRAATGEFIAFLDASDLWEPEKIATQLHALAQHPDAVACYTGLRIVGDSGEHLVDLNPPDPSTLRQVLRWSNPGIPLSSVLLRRSALERLGAGFDERLNGCEDWNLWLRLIAHGPFCVCPEPLTDYRSSADSPAEDAGHMYDDFMKMLDDVLLAGLHGIGRAIWRRRIMSYQAFKACLTARAAGDKEAERHFMMKSVSDWPSPFWAPERFRYFAVTAMRA
ncbi:MAG: glycosyltransferase family 2 protein [Acidobacteria bacterium]|nr:glycosyltransferase family 2 protein [Acidobacteriota bacterium]